MRWTEIDTIPAEDVLPGRLGFRDMASHSGNHNVQVVRVRPRPGAYKMSGCLRSSNISARGHSKGTSPCWMTEQKMLLHVHDSMYTKDFT